jgi:altronate hydrolase
MENNALKINPADNVVIAIRKIKKGDAVVVDGLKLVTAKEDILPSHKIALADIKTGKNIVRYGEPIVQAKEDITKGGWVHVHNTYPIDRDLKKERG